MPYALTTNILTHPHASCFLAVSGVVPEEPVFCAKSGHIYERRLVTKHIEQTGREPVTGEEVSVADLQPVRSNKVARPRPVGASSVGGMLALLQNEFDAMLLEAFQLRTELESTRQELSQALYQHDAACRVIARLVKERDNARSALAQSQSAMAARLAAMPQGAGDVEMGGAGSSAEGSSGAAAAAVAAGVTEATVSAIKDATKELSRARKKRAIPAETPAPEELARLGLAHAFSHHSSGSPGVASLDVLPSASQALLGSAGPAAPSGLPSLALSGGADGTALLLELPSAADASVSSGRVIGRLKGHGKRVTAAALVPGAGGAAAACVTGGADGSVRVWTPGTGGSDSWSPAGVVAAPFGGAREPVLSLSMHPTLPLACASSASGWALLDVSPGAPRGLYASGPVAPSGGGAFTVGLVHPDGAIYALGASDGSVRVFDLRSQVRERAGRPRIPLGSAVDS